MIRVAAAIIVHERRILLTQRRPDQAFPFRWECPGGKLQASDALGGACAHHVALSRELREELGVQVASITPQEPGGLVTVSVGSDGEEYEVSFFLVKLAAEPKPVAREGQGVGWFSKGEMMSLVWTPANEQAFWTIVKAIEDTR